MKGSRFLHPFLFALFAGTAVAEQAPANDDLLALSLKELLAIKVTGATRTSTPINQAPASVTVFTRNEIERMGIDFLYELLSYVPGFQTSRNNDYPTDYLYSARGSETAQDTTAILLLIDGIPRQEIRNASASGLSNRLDVDRIERIEIIRGPGSALYGSGAFLGVINIVTVADDNWVKAQAGEFNRRDLKAHLSGRSDDWFVDSYLSHYSDEGDHYRLDDRFSSTLLNTSDPQNIENYTLRAGYRNTRLTLEHMNIEADKFYSIGVINNPLNEHQHTLNAASLEHLFQWSTIDSQVRVSYSKNTLDYYAQGTRAGAFTTRSTPSSDAPLEGDVLYKSHDWLMQWLNDYRVNTDLSLQFGAEHRHEHITTAQVLANFDARAISNRQFPALSSTNRDIYNQVTDTLSREVLGLYTQALYRLNDKTNVTFGARYDDYENLDPETSLRLAMVRQLNGTDSIKLFYGEAYRAPSLIQLDSTENVTEVPNPDLGAESIRTSELVWLSQRANFTLSISAFYNIIDDRIDSSGFIGDRQSTVNQGTDYSSGTEIETSFQLSSNWLLRASYTEFFTLPESSFRESERLASMILNYQREQWWVNLSGYYNSHRDMPPAIGGSIEAFTIVNFKTGYRISNHITADMQIKNLLDDNAGSAPQRLGISTPIPLRGRETSVGLRYDF